MEEVLYKELSGEIIRAAYKVYNTLGAGFLEKVYENALIHELSKQGIKTESQVPVNVYYEDKKVGEYFADILVENKIIIELKAVTELTKAHEIQLINYLKATNIKLGLLINFGDKITIRRKIMDKKIKTK